MQFEFLDRFSKKSQISSFIKIRLVEPSFYMRIDGHDEANKYFKEYMRFLSFILCLNITKY
jgi:hypothetical protein